MYIYELLIKCYLKKNKRKKNPLDCDTILSVMKVKAKIFTCMKY